MSLEFKIIETETESILELVGKLDIYNANLLKKIFLENSFNKQRILVDLKNIHEFHISALQIFISAKKFFEFKNQNLKFINHSLAVLQVYDLLGITSKLGDKIHISKEMKNSLNFNYGTKKLYGTKL